MTPFNFLAFDTPEWYKDLKNLARFGFFSVRARLCFRVRCARCLARLVRLELSRALIRTVLRAVLRSFLRRVAIILKDNKKI